MPTISLFILILLPPRSVFLAQLVYCADLHLYSFYTFPPRCPMSMSDSTCPYLHSSSLAQSLLFPPGLPSSGNGLTVHLLSNLEDQESPWGTSVPLIPSTQSPSRPKLLMSIVSSQSPTVLITEERNLSQNLGIWIWCFGLRRDHPGESMQVNREDAKDRAWRNT